MFWKRKNEGSSRKGKYIIKINDHVWVNAFRWSSDCFWSLQKRWVGVQLCDNVKLGTKKRKNKTGRQHGARSDTSQAAVQQLWMDFIRNCPTKSHNAMCSCICISWPSLSLYDDVMLCRYWSVQPNIHGTQQNIQKHWISGNQLQKQWVVNASNGSLSAFQTHLQSIIFKLHTDKK